MCGVQAPFSIRVAIVINLGLSGKISKVTPKTKSMKPVISLLFISLCLINEAQSQQVNFSINVGSSFSNYKSAAQSVSVTSRTRMGYLVGLAGHIDIGRLSFQTALNYVQKGGKLKSNGFKDHLILHYLEIPLNVAFSIPVRENKFLVGGGPTLSFGMYGTDEWTAQGQSGKETIKFGNGSNKDFKTFEAGINFLTGFISDDGFMILLNYHQGLTNIMNNSDVHAGKFRTRYFGLKVGQIIFRR